MSRTNKKTGVTEVIEVIAPENTGHEPITPTKNKEVIRVTTKQKAADIVAGELKPESISRPCYRVYEHKTKTADGTFNAGTWFHGEKTRDNGNPVKTDTCICGPLHIIASTADKHGSNFGLLLKLKNRRGEWREWAMPMHMLATDCAELRRELLDMGLKLDTNNRQSLPRYLQSFEPIKRMTSASITGWHNEDLFILPTRNIGHGDAIFQSEYATYDDYVVSGTLEQWQQSIGALMTGNPLLQLAIGAALSGPLLYLIKRQGGGFHFYGDSSTGKTTLVEASCSVWGHGEDFKRTWRSTGNGLEGIAEQRNDTALILDELGEADPREVGNIVYSLGNGTGKSRANRSGNARPAKRWRLIFISTGERTLADIMNDAGKRKQAGQELRFIELSANRAHGCWDSLHQMEDGAKLSDAIKNACRAHYGTLGPAFISALISDDLSDLSTSVNLIRDSMTPDGGQEQRAAERFAIVATALELAAKYELLPLKMGEPTATMIELFNHWRQHRQNKNAETSAIIEQIADFISRNGDTMFSNIDDSSHDYPIRDRAGWWRDENGQRIWIFTSEGLKRAANCTNINRIIKALNDTNLIAVHDIGKSSKATTIQGSTKRLYHIASIDKGEA